MNSRAPFQKEMFEFILEHFNCAICGNLPKGPVVCSNKNCCAVFCLYCMMNKVMNKQRLCPICLNVMMAEKNSERIKQNLL